MTGSFVNAGAVTLIKSLSSNFALTSNSTPTQVTGLSIPVSAGQVWLVRISGVMSGGAGGGDITIHYTGTPASKAVELIADSPNSFVQFYPYNNLSIGRSSLDGTGTFASIECVLTITGGTSVDFYFAQDSSNVATSTLNAGAFILATRIS